LSVASALRSPAFRAQLEAGEFALMKPNTPIAQAEVVAALAQALKVVRHEHERWDGDGYPDRLAGAVMAELTGNAGIQFDPKVVEALVGYLYGRRQSGLATV